MLKYLITVTEDCLFLAVVIGLMYSAFRTSEDRNSRIILSVGMGIGLVAAGVMSWFKNNTRLIDTGRANMYLLIVSFSALVLFYLASLLCLIRRERFRHAMGVVSAVLGAFTVATFVFYVLPDVYAYPNAFVLTDESILSTEFLYKLIGYVIGLILVFVTMIAVYRAACGVPHGGVTALFLISTFLFELRMGAKSLQYIRLHYTAIKKFIPFSVVQVTTKYANNAIYAAMIIAALLAVAALIRSFTYKEPYENPAQRRKIDAKWRRNRRWAITVAACIAIALIIVTAVKAYVNRPVELSPTEEVEIVGTDVYVSLDKVADGHLHRFTYVTDNGIGIRFIVIKKPNSQAYGVGLDACDICGETGYYERNGQVVCKLCDVVMNINTIGFKGGCNPIVIDYSVKDGYIIVPISELEAHESTFK